MKIYIYIYASNKSALKAALRCRKSVRVIISMERIIRFSDCAKETSVSRHHGEGFKHLRPSRHCRIEEFKEGRHSTIVMRGLRVAIN